MFRLQQIQQRESETARHPTERENESEGQREISWCTGRGISSVMTQKKKSV
uniref:Uncharacterized protein n=1 Tax=Anguilla anguilla TaxID=7936 RepID=A0A0E9SPX9_ANGAN